VVAEKMKRHLIVSSLVLLIATLFPALAGAQSDYPHLTAVTPDTGRAGDELTVEGENLGKALVRELFLTDGTTDYKTEIVEQSSTTIRFRIATDTKPGRFNLMVLTGDIKEPRLIEQPIKVTVE
jgi:hypothetical protein